jgi:tetratricopeptide (TPR) repeat protein
MFIVVSLLAGAIATYRQYQVAQRERAKAVVVNTLLQTMLNASRPEVNASNLEKDLTVKEVLDEAARRLSTDELSNVPDVKAELQRIIGASYLARSQYGLAEENLTAALATQSRITGENSVEALKIQVQLGTLWMSTGAYQKADQFYERSLGLLRQYQQNGAIEPDYLASSLSNYALRRRSLGDSKQAASLLREALALPYQPASQTRFSRVVAETILALMLADQGEFDEAIRIVRAKVLFLRQQPNSEAELSATLTGLGSF